MSGEYSKTLWEYLEYQEFLSKMRLNYTDESVLKFDDDFRRIAKNERLGLVDHCSRKVLADEYTQTVVKAKEGSKANVMKATTFAGALKTGGLVTNILAAFCGRTISALRMQPSVPAITSVVNVVAITALSPLSRNAPNSITGGLPFGVHFNCVLGLSC